MSEEQPGGWVGVAVRVGVYALLVYTGLVLFGWLAFGGGYLVSSTAGVFLSGIIANTLAMRIFERTHLANVGLLWNPASVRNLLLGLAGGIGAACLVLVIPLIAGLAELQPAADAEFHWRSLFFVSVALLFGAAGEELVFRGYGFQVLVGALGPYATILPVSLLFAFAHSGNLNVSWLGLANTALWGVLLGAAFLRSGDLWLPIGLHFGWNWTLPLFGVSLSGFTMEITGYSMRWKVGPLWSGGAYGPEGGILTCAVLVLLAVYLWRVPVRRQVPFLLRARWEE
jgi:membrane protease YdiL (CAAX protease family)